MNQKTKYLFLAVLITTIIVTAFTLSRYRTTVFSKSSAKVATPVINLSNDTLNIEINPVQNLQSYVFEVSNYEDENESEVSMVYNLQIKTANALPLEFELYNYDETTNAETGNNLLVTNNTTDEIEMKEGQKRTNKYILKIKWKEDQKNYLYSKEIDYIQLVLNSHQAD